MPWKKEDMPDLDGKVAVVTGANSGLGYETARALAEKNCEVVLACRNHDKANKARNKIEKEFRDPDLRIIELDLADLSSVNDFARRYREKYDRLDFMVNNAGVMHLPFRRTDFGFEYQFGVNHLGHFYLNSQLMELIEDTEDSRVVCVSSLLHKKAELEFDSLNDRESYNKKTAYADSKMANLLYAKELDSRFKQEEIDSKAVAVHPGYSDTNLQIRAAKTAGGKLKLAGMKAMNKVVAQSAEKGALPTLHGCTAELEGGEFIGPDGFKEIRGNPTQVEPDPRAENQELRQELWKFSEEELGINFEV
jgi:NAD(P)-dependent dehydrogenase (short-subunit alcohol dehydrogenase family)